MPETRRSSARLAAGSDSNAKSEDGSPTAGDKRKADSSVASSPSAKKPEKKTQKTIEETAPQPESPTKKEEKTKPDEGKGGEDVDMKDSEAETTGENKQISPDGDAKEAPSNGAVEESPSRAKAMPSNIVEKGILYVFTRGRVGIEEPEGVSDLQRTYFVLRPLPKGAKLTDGPLEDAPTNRLFAIPKKAFPKRRSDRLMAFTEKGPTTIKNLKESFFGGEQHRTATRGKRETPPVIPVAEGVYAITELERSTHLAYMITIPEKIGEVQEDLGLMDKGSFVMSVKNPARPGPANARLPQGPDFPDEIMKEFRGLAWIPVKPHHLDYANVQTLLIGEGTEGDVGKALDQTKKDAKQDKEAPGEEMEALEYEDEQRVQHLHGDDTVFDDLGISHKDYPKVPTTW
ncbi:hypothetical protein BDY21DRAFT_344253 [Lineolata rhizophorae]|uniref:BTB domain transcription factor n=1 Tax=Lineolata rhizophorae TaxID=578093 RepID=A0A6A6P0Q7_9PEZI|nr:hypothetical protein BDY21DRAFT_344253 [Lineolata rhizophorae]